MKIKNWSRKCSISMRIRQPNFHEIASGGAVSGKRVLFSLLITTLTRTKAAATLSDLEYGAYPGWKSQSDSQSLCPSPVIMISPLKKEINPIRHAQVLYVQNNTLKNTLLEKAWEAAWPSGWSAGLVIRRPRVQVSP